MKMIKNERYLYITTYSLPADARNLNKTLINNTEKNVASDA